MSFADISRSAMELYCKLLNRWELLCVDTIYKKIGDRDENFWVHFLSEVCFYPAELARLCFKNQENLLTHNIFVHYTKVKPNIHFYKMAAKFFKLSEANLAILNEMCANWRVYDLFFELMPTK